MADLKFTVSLPSDEGFIGRECANLNCARYFRVHAESLADEMHCPYCGQRFARDNLLTRDQIDYLTEAATEQTLEYVSTELAKMFGQLERGNRGNTFVTFKAGKPYRAKTVQPHYVERQVDSEIVCPECRSRFQVDGIFAHCVRCGIESIAVYDANLEVIRAEVAAASDPQRALRHAYNDLVSTFESICGNRASSLTGEHGSFQDPYEARRFFKKHLGIDVLGGLDQDQELAVRRVFHRRHAWQHSRGIISERYVKKVPEDRDLEGLPAPMSMTELEEGATGVRLMLDTLPARET